MKKEDQEKFYQTIGRELTKARERKNMTVSQLAKKSGEQFNTIKAIEDGHRFSFHQASWMKEVLGMNLNILLADAINTNNIDLKEEENGIEEESVSIGDFI